MSYLSISWGNLLRNRRRTVSTLAAIGIGVSMIVLTNGFTDGISASLSDSLVNQIDSHLRIEHRDYKKYAITDQEKILIRDYRPLAAELMQNPHVRAVMPRVITGGLLGKDDKSTTFIGAVYDLATLRTVLPDYGKNLVAGKLLAEDDPDGVLVGETLAKSLGLSIGDDLVLLSKTVHGEQSNALVHVRGVVTFPQDKAVEQSLVVGARGKSWKDNLLDLGDGATQLLVRVDDIDNVPAVEEELNRQFAQKGLPWRVVPWYESKVYSQMVGMFNGIGGVIMLVLIMMVGMITSNALLMAFFERIREIGTLRAIGMRKMDVYQMLYTESVIVGTLGTLFGLGGGALLVLLGWYVGIPLGGMVNLDVHPTLSANSVIASVAAPIVAIVVAASIPIRAASKMSVIESLNYH
jgi:putative ABC transport system permease protein